MNLVLNSNIGEADVSRVIDRAVTDVDVPEAMIEQVIITDSMIDEAERLMGFREHQQIPVVAAGRLRPCGRASVPTTEVI